MANGIEDLTSIMTQGGRDDIPQPMMGGGLGAMMPQQSAPMPPPDMGGMSPDMMMAEEMAMQEEPISIEQDAGALAEAVVGRAQGDIGAAVAILDTAKAMLIQSTQQDPMMMADGGQLKAIPENNKGLAKFPYERHTLANTICSSQVSYINFPITEYIAATQIQIELIFLHEFTHWIYCKEKGYNPDRTEEDLISEELLAIKISHECIKEDNAKSISNGRSFGTPDPHQRF